MKALGLAAVGLLLVVLAVALMNRDPFSPTDCGPGVPACTAPTLFPINTPPAGR